MTKSANSTVRVEMVRVAVIDPGVTTGLVLAILHLDDKPHEVVVMERKMSCYDLYKWLHGNDPRIVVIEDFEYRPNLGQNVTLYSRNLMGIAQLYHEQGLAGLGEAPESKLYIQKPSTGVGGYFKSKDRLKERGLYVPNLVHGMDAVRHFLTWHTFKGGYPYLRNPETYKLVKSE